MVISLQTLLEYELVVGGRSALEIQGYGHYFPQESTEVHLYGPKPPPGWLKNLPLAENFVYHNSSPLFGNDLAGWMPPQLEPTSARRSDPEADLLRDAGASAMPWGQWDWPLVVSTPERAVLELLDELPVRESFHQVDVLMDGLPSLSPRRLQRLLGRCRSVKVKRLFFFFADRHVHAWLAQVNRASIDLGSGKRKLAERGRLDPTYQITVPKEMYDTQ